MVKLNNTELKGQPWPARTQGRVSRLKCGFYIGGKTLNLVDVGGRETDQRDTGSQEWGQAGRYQRRFPSRRLVLACGLFFSTTNNRKTIIQRGSSHMLHTEQKL